MISSSAKLPDCHDENSNNWLLRQKLIKKWQYLIREDLPLTHAALKTAPSSLKPNKTPPHSPTKFKKFAELDKKTLEAIQDGIRTKCLLPHEAAIEFGIRGGDIAEFLNSQNILYSDSPQSAPLWAKLPPLNQLPPSPPLAPQKDLQPLNLTPHYLGPFPKYEALSKEAEEQLILQARSSDPNISSKAEEKLIVANLRLVSSLARKTQYGVPLEDLISEGILGLRTAIQKFDPNMGSRLSTYAIWWIKFHLRKTHSESKIIRIPLHQQQRMRLIQAAITNLTEITGFPPSDEEVSEETGIKPHTINTLRNLTTPILSLQTPVGYLPESRTFEETLADTSPSGRSPLEALQTKHAQATLQKIFVTRLNAQEQEVLNLRFGLTTLAPKTLDETGKALTLTRERIRQIQNKALKKLKESLQAHQNMETTLAYLDKSKSKK